MPFLILAALLKGPVWLRLLILIGFAVMIFFGCLSALSIIRQATERTPPSHVHHVHQLTTSYHRTASRAH